MNFSNFDRNSVLQYISEQNRILAANIIDKILISEKTFSTVSTDFLDMFQQTEVEVILNKLNVYYKFFGGYDKSERKVLFIYPTDDCIFDPETFLQSINITYNTKFIDNLSHRDVLGSILALGINRDKIGDILLHEGFVQVVTTTEIALYIQNNLQKIRNFGVNVKPLNLDHITPIQQHFKDITAIVPSTRLDCIVESGFNISRSTASKLIQSQNAFVNWKLVSKPSHEVQPNDVISVRGYGRIVFDSIKGNTRKNNIAILIKQLL